MQDGISSVVCVRERAARPRNDEKIKGSISGKCLIWDVLAKEKYERFRAKIPSLYSAPRAPPLLGPYSYSGIQRSQTTVVCDRWSDWLDVRVSFFLALLTLQPTAKPPLSLCRLRLHVRLR